MKLVLSSRCRPEGAVAEEAAGSPVHASPGVQEPLSEGEEIELPYQDLSDHLDIDHDDAPLRLRSMDAVVGQAPVPGLAARDLQQEQLHAVSADEPSSLEDAERDPHWRAAMVEEIRAIEENGTWSLTDLPPDRKAIGLKWVFKVKRDEQGLVVKYKARLVVKGYS